MKALAGFAWRRKGGFGNSGREKKYQLAQTGLPRRHPDFTDA
jgi:hypothetical protein